MKKLFKRIPITHHSLSDDFQKAMVKKYEKTIKEDILICEKVGELKCVKIKQTYDLTGWLHFLDITIAEGLLKKYEYESILEKPFAQILRMLGYKLWIPYKKASDEPAKPPVKIEDKTSTPEIPKDKVYVMGEDEEDDYWFDDWDF